MRIDAIDVRRAHFHAPARIAVCVELPEDDATPGMCGRLDKSMYGSRDAARNREGADCGFVVTAGFRRRKGSPCVFFHPQRKLRAIIHEDDFAIMGSPLQPGWLRGQISQRFEVKF